VQGAFKDIRYEWRGHREAHDLPTGAPERLSAQTLFELTEAFTAARDDRMWGDHPLWEGPDAFCSVATRRSVVMTATSATTPWPSGHRALNVLDSRS